MSADVSKVNFCFVRAARSNFGQVNNGIWSVYIQFPRDPIVVGPPRAITSEDPPWTLSLTLVSSLP